MTVGLVRCCIPFAVACGHHDTPLATYHAPLPDGSEAGTAAGGSADARADPLCVATYPTIVDGLTSHYRQGATAQIWVDAERDCESDGGHLIVIDDDAENLWMSSIAKKSVTNDGASNQLSWIGLADQVTEGDFHWVTGPGLTLQSWADGEPNSQRNIEDCVEIRQTGMWNDDHCWVHMSYVCECDGIPTANNWCDTDTAMSCGDCSSPCPQGQTCVDQQCK